MIELQRLTGMRPGEVVVMRTQDVDATGRLWTYTPQRHKTQHRGHSRTVFLGPKAQAIVTPWLRPNVAEYLFQPAEADAEARAARTAARETPTNQGNRPRKRRRRPGRKPGARYTVASYRRAIADGCEKAFGMPPNLREPRTAKQKQGRADEDPAKRKAAREAWRAENVWHPNQLRHTAATFLRKRYGLEAAQVILGHRRADVTQIYAERDVAAAQRIMSEVG
jgi:integrase